MRLHQRRWVRIISSLICAGQYDTYASINPEIFVLLSTLRKRDCNDFCMNDCFAVYREILHYFAE